MTERDKRISDQLVRLVQIVFGLVLAQSLLLHRDLILHPLLGGNWVGALALTSVYLTTVLSWIDWHITMEIRPYNFNSHNKHRVTEEMRLGLDLFIVTLYAYLLFTVEEIRKKPEGRLDRYLLGFCIIFLAYLVSGLARRRSHGKLATNPKPIVLFGLAYVGLFVGYWYGYAAVAMRFAGVLRWLNALGILVALGLMLAYRMIRRRIVSNRREAKRQGLTIGVDVDGVLANQIEGIIPRVRRRLGILLSYEDVTQWRLPLGDSDIAQEIGLAFDDADYVLDMPPHAGARELVDALYPNNNVVLITARPAQTRPWTLQWLENHGFSFDELVNAKEQKKSLHLADLLVDDYLGNVEEYLRNTDGTAILVDQPWNRTGREALDTWVSQERVYFVNGLREAKEAAEQVRRSRSNEATRQNADATLRDFKES